MNQKRLKIYSWLLIAIGFIFTANTYWLLQLGYHYPLYDLRRVISLFFLGSLTLLGIIIPSINARIQFIWQQIPKWIHYAIGVFFVIGLVSSIHAQLPRYALLQLTLYIFLIFSAFVIAAFVQLWGKTNWGWLMSILGLSIAGLCITQYYLIGQWLINIHTVAQQGFKFNISDKVIERVTKHPTFTNIRFLSQALSWTWPILVLPLMDQQSNKIRYCLWAIPFFVLASIWWSIAWGNESRALMLEWVIIPLLVLAIYRKLGLHWLKWQILTAAVGFILFLVVNHHLVPHMVDQIKPNTHHHVTSAANDSTADSATKSSSQFSSHYRLYIYYVASKLAWNHPILGVGPMHFAYEAWPLLQGKSGVAKVAHPHSLWLYIASDWGFIALALLLAVFIKSIFSIIKQSIREINDYRLSIARVCVASSFAAAMFHACFSGILIMPLSQALLVIICGWMLALYLPQSNEPEHVNVIPWIVSAVIMLVAASLFIYGIYPTWDNWIYLITHYRSETGRVDVLPPNFWSQGFIYFWPK